MTVQDDSREAEDSALAARAWAFVSREAHAPYLSHPAYGDCARRTLNNWALKVREYAAIERSLRDLAHWAAAEAALMLAAEPEGFTAGSLSRLLRSMKMISRGRAPVILTYLQYLKLIEPSPEGGKGAEKQYRAKPDLAAFIRLRMRRDLEAMAPLDPRVEAAIARWDEPGVFERFMAAGRGLALCSARYKQEFDTLDRIIERNAGMTIIGQLLLSDDDGQVFPRRDGVRLNVLDVVRRSGAPRHQVMHIVKLGREGGLFLDQPDGTMRFSDHLIARFEQTLGTYWRALLWRSEAAIAL